MKKDFNLNRLATTVMWWLSYTSAVGRKYVLSESAIKFPVAEYLQSTANEVELEFGHPKLFMKRFDLFFKNKLGEKNVFEFKYIKNGSTRTIDEKQRIFNDLMRFYLYLEDNQKGYFLICGDHFEFSTNFQFIRLNPVDTDSSLYIKPHNNLSTPPLRQSEGFYTEWFSFDSNNPDKIINLNTANAEYDSIYSSFIAEYLEPYSRKMDGNSLELPDDITTNLIFLSQNDNEPRASFQPYKIGIWEVTKTAAL